MISPGRRHHLRDTIPADAGQKAAEKALRRLNHHLDEQLHPRTGATLDQLLDRIWRPSTSGALRTRMYTRYLERHVSRSSGG